MYTPKQVADGIARAVTETIDALEATPDLRIIEASHIVKWSGLEPPAYDDEMATHHSWAFNLMSLRERWRDEILSQTGRYPRTVRSHGFELLSHGETVDYASGKATRDIISAIRRSNKILRKTRDNELTARERQLKLNHQMRLAAMEVHANQALQDAYRDRIKPPTQSDSDTPQD